MKFALNIASAVVSTVSAAAGAPAKTRTRSFPATPANVWCSCLHFDLTGDPVLDTQANVLLWGGERARRRRKEAHRISRQSPTPSSIEPLTLPVAVICYTCPTYPTTPVCTVLHPPCLSSSSHLELEIAWEASSRCSYDKVTVSWCKLFGGPEGRRNIFLVRFACAMLSVLCSPWYYARHSCQSYPHYAM